MISPVGRTASSPRTYLLRRAVLEGARTAGTLGHVATDRRLPQRRGVRRVEEADALDGVLQIAGDDVGLDHGNEVDLVDLQDPVHPVHGQHDPAQAGHGPAGVAAAAAARDDRLAMRSARADDRGDLRRVGREHDNVRGMAPLQCVGAVGEASGLVGADVLRADGTFELGEEPWVSHASTARPPSCAPRRRGDSRGSWPCRVPARGARSHTTAG